MAEKVLIVDDDLETLRLVSLMLQQRHGYQVITASNGKKALELASAEVPDLVVLDIMMPDMDGLEVIRQLRANSTMAKIPILVFTARSQVEDKVAGYEAGADDYLTKPTHPIELATKIRSLLARSVKVQPVAPVVERGYLLAVMAAKGGLGCSTLALNLGVSLHKKVHNDVIVAELRPGFGTLGLELGYVHPQGLKHLIQIRPDQLNPVVIEKELVTNASGVRLLLSGNDPREIECVNATAQLEAILKQLAYLAPVVVADIGTNMLPGYDRILELFNEVIVVVEPIPNTVVRTKALLEDLTGRGFGTSKLITLAQVTRIRSDVMLTLGQVQESLGLPIPIAITSAPELAYQASLRFTPMSLIHPDSLTAQQMDKAAEHVFHHIQKG